MSLVVILSAKQGFLPAQTFQVEGCHPEPDFNDTYFNKLYKSKDFFKYSP